MKLNETAWANTSAILIAIIYIVCAAFIAGAPEFSKSVAESWFHGIDLSSIWTGAPRGNFVVGLLSAVVASWLTGWAFAWIYNKLAK